MTLKTINYGFFILFGVFIGKLTCNLDKRVVTVPVMENSVEDSIVKGQAVHFRADKIYIGIQRPQMIIERSKSRVTYGDFPNDLGDLILEKCQKVRSKYYVIVDLDKFNRRELSKNDVLITISCIADDFRAGVIHGYINSTTQGVYGSASEFILVNLEKHSSDYLAIDADDVVKAIFTLINTKSLDNAL